MPLRAFCDSDVADLAGPGEQCMVLMPLRAFCDSDVYKFAWYFITKNRVLMPLRAFCDSDEIFGLGKAGKLECLNALAGIL